MEVLVKNEPSHGPDDSGAARPPRQQRLADALRLREFQGAAGQPVALDPALYVAWAREGAGAPGSGERRQARGRASELHLAFG